MAFVTKEYDFFVAITKNMKLNSEKYKGFNHIKVDLIKVDHVTPSSSIVETSHGTFFCETFEDLDANIYMKVFDFI